MKKIRELKAAKGTSADLSEQLNSGLLLSVIKAFESGSKPAHSHGYT